MKDPLIYRMLAIGNLVTWSAFFLLYAREVLRKRGGGKRVTIRALFIRLRAVEPFASALLGVAVAMVVYSVATVLKQFLGADYWGRDAYRGIASAALMLSGVTITWALWRERRRD